MATEYALSHDEMVVLKFLVKEMQPERTKVLSKNVDHVSLFENRVSVVYNDLTCSEFRENGISIRGCFRLYNFINSTIACEANRFPADRYLAVELHPSKVVIHLE